jgi:hypothetical protein
MLRSPVLKFKVHIMILASLAAYLSACTGRVPEQPGDVPNEKLAEMINSGIEEEIRRMNPTWSPGLLPQAPEQARQWLREIAEVVARCRYGPANRSKGNLLEYDITLGSGERIEAVPSGQRCLYDVARPLVMRVRFDAGRAGAVMTDGRERALPVDASLAETRLFAQSVLRADWSRRPARYFPPDKTAEEISRGWDRKP